MPFLRKWHPGTRRRRPPCARIRLQIEALEQRSLLAAPQIGNLLADNWPVPQGKTSIVPVAGFDADGDRLTYTVMSDNPNLTAEVKTGNPYLRMTIAGMGEMVFELFRDIAPRTVDIISGLVQSGFYNGLTFHRIVPNFVIQGGDPNGNGSGGPPGPGNPDRRLSFDDEFHRDMLFSSVAQLAMANSGDDTNGSQFFITLGQPRHLDMEHTIFGQMTHGFSTLVAISRVQLQGETPVTPVVISKMELVENKFDAVLVLRSTTNTATTANLTIKAADGKGGMATKRFKAMTFVDSTNAPPYLGPVQDLVIPQGAEITMDLTSTDVEGDAVTYVASLNPQDAGRGTVSVDGNKVTFKPNPGQVGPIRLRLQVRQNTGSQRLDTQEIVVAVGDQPLTGQGTDIQPLSGVMQNDLVVATFTDADPASNETQFNAFIKWGDGQISDGTVAPNPAGGYLVRGNHTYNRPGDYPVQVVIQDALRGARIMTASRAQVAVGVKINNTTASENATARFSIELTGPSTQTIMVNYATVNGTAIAGEDYRTTQGRLTFRPGELTKMVRVPLINDAKDEPDETFLVRLSNPTNAGLADDEAQGTITDNDDAPTLSIRDLVIKEGDDGAVNAVFQAALKLASGKTVMVDFASADGTAMAGQDYAAVNGPLTFLPGETRKEIVVPILGDRLNEATETFFVNLANAVNATLVRNQIKGSIQDNDPKPRIGIDDVQVVEGVEGSMAVFTVTLSAASGRVVTVSFAAVNGTAKAPGDYTPARSMLTFQPGETTKQIAVTIVNDADAEPNETFLVKLSAAVNAVLGDAQGLATILDDDAG